MAGTGMPIRTVAATDTAGNTHIFNADNGELVHTVPANGAAAPAAAPAAAMRTNYLKIPGIDQVLANQKQIDDGNSYLLPKNFTATVSSAAGGSTTRVYVMNETSNALGNQVTSNGATAITYSYTDGFGGRNISRTLAYARGGVGLVCRGVQLTFNIIATGAADVTGLNGANAYFVQWDPVTGQPKTFQVNTAANQSRSDTNFGLSVEAEVLNISNQTQLSFLIPSGTVVTATFYMNPEYRM